MDTVSLLQKVDELEQAIGVEGPTALRRLAAELRECALEVQRHSPEQARRDSREHYTLTALA